MQVPGRDYQGVIMPPIVNRYTRLVGIDHPIVQEGLGPFRTPKLAAAVSNAGGLPRMAEEAAAILRSLSASLAAPARAASEAGADLP
jgi:NAD(P)H-dependent flavin oxidoreductase YrpB (nitropropane dioxygenase family)